MNEMLAKIGVCALAVAAAFGGGYWSGHASNKAEVTAMKQTMHDADVAAKAQVDLLNKDIKTRQDLLDLVPQEIDKMKGERDAAKSQTNSLRADLATARKRMSVVITPGSCNRTEQSEAAKSAGLGSQSTTTADIDPAVAAGLVGLTERGDNAIRRLNACLAAYQAAQQATQ